MARRQRSILLRTWHSTQTLTVFLIFCLRVADSYFLGPIIVPESQSNLAAWDREVLRAAFNSPPPASEWSFSILAAWWVRAMHFLFHENLTSAGNHQKHQELVLSVPLPKAQVRWLNCFSGNPGAWPGLSNLLFSFFDRVSCSPGSLWTPDPYYVSAS